MLSLESWPTISDCVARLLHLLHRLVMVMDALSCLTWLQRIRNWWIFLFTFYHHLLQLSTGNTWIFLILKIIVIINHDYFFGFMIWLWLGIFLIQEGFLLFLNWFGMLQLIWPACMLPILPLKLLYYYVLITRYRIGTLMLNYC